MRAVVDLSGKRFGRWAVIRRSAREHRRVLYVCRCDCGAIRDIVAGNLRRGFTKSCGCLRVEVSRARCLDETRHPAVRHGHARDQRRSAEYNAWSAAKSRCSNPHDRHYADYGGRGITMCAAWRASFERFFADMGARPPGTTLDRIDNDGPYAPGNCRWATPKVQASNRRPKNTRTGAVSGQQAAAGPSSE